MKESLSTQQYSGGYWNLLVFAYFPYVSIFFLSQVVLFDVYSLDSFSAACAARRALGPQTEFQGCVVEADMGKSDEEMICDMHLYICIFIYIYRCFICIFVLCSIHTEIITNIHRNSYNMYYNYCIEILSLCLLRFEHQDPHKKCMLERIALVNTSKRCKYFSTWPSTGVTRSGLANLNVDVTDKAFGSIQRCSFWKDGATACNCQKWILDDLGGKWKFPVPKALTTTSVTFFPP